MPKLVPDDAVEGVIPLALAPPVPGSTTRLELDID